MVLCNLLHAGEPCSGRCSGICYTNCFEPLQLGQTCKCSKSRIYPASCKCNGAQLLTTPTPDR